MMPAIPLPFVSSLLLIILIVRLIGRREPSLRPTIVFVSACAMLTTIVGLRWSVDIRGIRFLQPVIACALPPIAWVCFCGLVGPGRAAGLWLHAIPVGLVAVLSASWPLWHPPIDLFLAVQFLGYGAALARLGRRGPDGLASTRLSDAEKAQKATLIAGLVLMGSGTVDLLIAGDVGIYGGIHAATIVGMANMVMLPVMACAVAIVGTSISAPETVPFPQGDPPDDATVSPPLERLRAPTPDDASVVEAVDRVMRQKQLFRDPDLTLNRLARRVGIPARRISAAINRVFGRSVSQVVNEYRIEEARKLLARSDLPITTILFEAGFQTKSNFNREFLRVVGMSPSDYRRANPQPPDTGGSIEAGSPAPGNP